MNGRQREVIAHSLGEEKKLLGELRQNYAEALADVKGRIRELQSDPLTQSKIYRLEYQRALEKQLTGALDALGSKNFESISSYLNGCYVDGFVGNMYDMQGQGVGLTLPMDEKQIAAAVSRTADDYKLSDKLGGNTKLLRQQVKAHIQRGLAQEMSYSKIARAISDEGEADMRRAMRIVRTEGARIQNAAKLDSMHAAAEKGADIVKQWDSTLDSKTRPEHAKLDGQIRELGEDFEVDGYSAPCPGNFGDPAMDCNCRCTVLQRARWALDDPDFQSTKMNNESKEIIECRDYAEFKEKYLEKVAKTGESGIINTDNRFHSNYDPMREAMGSAEESHPQDTKILIQELQDMGVRLKRPKEESLAYEPNVVSGKPGTVIISQGASYSAWLHEVQHAKDDYNDGWLGYRVFQNPKICAQREIEAYQLEIDLANSIGRKDIAKRLEELRDDEIKKYIY